MGSIARVTEISARSEESFQDAVNEAMDRANQTLRNVRSGWVKEQRVVYGDSGVSAYQVNVEVTFELDDA